MIRKSEDTVRTFERDAKISRDKEREKLLD